MIHSHSRDSQHSFADHLSLTCMERINHLRSVNECELLVLVCLIRTVQYCCSRASWLATEHKVLCAICAPR